MLKNKVPNHLAIILDGNGRWAKSKGLVRSIGHKVGAKTAKAVEDAGWRLDISAPNPQTPSITAAIDLFFKENKVNKK